MQGDALGGTLASLAAPLATAVAHLEALMPQELEEDSWLKDGAGRVAYLSQKLLACGALRCHLAAPATPLPGPLPPAHVRVASVQHASGKTSAVA